MSRAMPEPQVRTERTFQRFTVGQRWEHAVLILSVTVQLITGLLQKFRSVTWSQQLLATPERVKLVQDIHHISAVVLILLAVYHLGRGIVLLSRRKLSADIFPTWDDVRDAASMVRYLLFLSKEKPRFGKYSFEQKFTYWFLFVAFGILGVSGLILWFPEIITRILPGGVIPAAKFAHSTEAMIVAVFVFLWHVYHVHVERLNLSMFTGRLSEKEMQEHHAQEYDRLVSSEAHGEGV